MGSLSADKKFPVGTVVTVMRLNVGTLAALGDRGTVITLPYEWYKTPRGGPRQCVVVEMFDGLHFQVRTKDLKADPVPTKAGLPAERIED
jgi:hypothetical protein